MQFAPASAGQSNRTFSITMGEGFFISPHHEEYRYRTLLHGGGLS
jgi:hypothetical protein